MSIDDNSFMGSWVFYVISYSKNKFYNVERNLFFDDILDSTKFYDEKLALKIFVEIKNTNKLIIDNYDKSNLNIQCIRLELHDCSIMNGKIGE